MQIHRSDFQDRSAPGVWRGLMLTVEGARRAGLSVSVCPPRCIRIAAGERPLLWARIDDDYWGYELLRTSQAVSPMAIPPIPFELVRAHLEHEPAMVSRAWARTFADMLESASSSPLVDGRWLLRCVNSGSRGLSSDWVKRIVEQRLHGYVEWDFGDDVYPVTLRKLSSRDSGRVHAWRKHARSGTLPPILLWWVTGLSAHVVIDGHDRLLAAAIEGVSVPAFSLETVEEHHADETVKEAVLEQIAHALTTAECERRRAPSERLARARRLISVEDANRVLLSTFIPELRSAATRAGICNSEDWFAEVRRELTLQGVASGMALAAPGASRELPESIRPCRDRGG